METLCLELNWASFFSPSLSLSLLLVREDKSKDVTSLQYISQKKRGQVKKKS